MSDMFTNKHVVVAMLVAPVLAIMAWFAVDHFIGEKPHAAKPGAAYSLIAKSNCRYDSGQCDLANGDFELTLRPADITATGAVLELVSRFPLQSATVALVEASNDNPPSALAPSDANSLHWQGAIDRPRNETSSVRIAVVAQETTYYAEVPVVFMKIQF